MPEWKKLLPKKDTKDVCQVCGKKEDLMNYKYITGEPLLVCSNECLFIAEPNHPILSSYPEDWKKIRTLIKQRDDLNLEIEKLQKGV